MTEEVEIHRESVSRSIQYSDYSSGDELQPPSPQPQTTPITAANITPIVNNDDNDDDESSSSSSYETVTKQIQQNKENTKKRTSNLIQSKMQTVESKLKGQDDTKQNDENIETRQRGQSNSGGTTRKDKKANLAARWQRLVKANQNNSDLHESQQPINKKQPKSIHEGDGQHGIGKSNYNNDIQQQNYKKTPCVINKSVSKGVISNGSPSDDPYFGLSPIEIWKKKKEERERAKMGNNNNNGQKQEQEQSQNVDINVNVNVEDKDKEDFAAELKKQQMEEWKKEEEDVQRMEAVKREKEEKERIQRREREEEVERQRKIEEEEQERLKQEELVKEQEAIKRQKEIKEKEEEEEEQQRLKEEALIKEQEEQQQREMEEKAERDRIEKEEAERLEIERVQKEENEEKERQKEMEMKEERDDRIQRERELKEERLRKEQEQADKLKEAIAAERKAMMEEEARKRALMEEEERLRDIEEMEEEKRRQEIEEKRMRKQQILEKIKKEKERKKEEVERLKEEEEEEEDVMDVGMEFDKEKFMEGIYNHFVYDEESILMGEYVLLYMTESVGIESAECDDIEGVLKNVMLELFGDEVVSIWGYHVRLL